MEGKVKASKVRVHQPPEGTSGLDGHFHVYVFDVFNQAFLAGAIVGIIIAVIISASIPLSLGIKRGHPVVGLIGAVCSGGAAVLLGCLGGLPTAL